MSGDPMNLLDDPAFEVWAEGQDAKAGPTPTPALPPEMCPCGRPASILVVMLPELRATHVDAPERCAYTRLPLTGEWVQFTRDEHGKKVLHVGGKGPRITVRHERAGDQ